MWPFKSKPVAQAPKPEQPKKKIAKPIEELRTYNVGRGSVKITSTDGVVELRDIKGYAYAKNLDYYAKHCADRGVCYQVPESRQAEVVTLQDQFNEIVSNYGWRDSKHSLSPDPNTRILHQVVHSVELLNVQDLSVDVEVTVGYELLDAPTSDTVD